MRPPFLALLALGCASAHPSEPSYQPPSVIEMPGFGSNAQVLEVPATVRAGIPFAITYATFGSSSCSRHRTPETSAGADFLLILPRLAPIPPGTPCTEDLATVRHTISMTWPTPIAELRIIVRGVRFDGTGVDVVRRIRVE